jgi:hypothetical protein
MRKEKSYFYKARVDWEMISEIEYFRINSDFETTRME